MSDNTVESNQTIIMAILIGLIIALCGILGVVGLPPLWTWIRRKMPVSKARILRRYATIDGWLVTKTVKAHDEVCDCIKSYYSVERAALRSQTQLDEPRISIAAATEREQRYLTVNNLIAKLAPAKTSSSIDETQDATKPSLEHRLVCDENENEDDKEHGDDGSIATASSSATLSSSCPICMESFTVGQTVSWSTSNDCHHVFHHSCLREWLLRHTECPCCRTTVLSVDRPKVRSQSIVTGGWLFQQQLVEDELQTLAQERAISTATSYFCIQDGLVRLHGFGTICPTVIESTGQVPQQQQQQQELLNSIAKGHGEAGDGRQKSPQTRPLRRPRQSGPQRRRRWFGQQRNNRESSQPTLLGGRLYMMLPPLDSAPPGNSSDSSCKAAGGDDNVSMEILSIDTNDDVDLKEKTEISSYLKRTEPFEASSSASFQEQNDTGGENGVDIEAPTASMLENDSTREIMADEGKMVAVTMCLGDLFEI